MTDLTDDELRAACEKAGLEVHEGNTGALVETPLAYVYTHEMGPAGDMLRAYVASLLVARVRKTHASDILEQYEDELMWQLVHGVFATDAQRIRAAMAVLEGEQ